MTDLLSHPSRMSITSNSHTHVPAASHLPSCQIRGVSDLCRESLKSSRLRKRGVGPAKKLSAGFASVAKSLGEAPLPRKVFEAGLCARLTVEFSVQTPGRRHFECTHACERVRERSIHNGEEISSQTSLIVGIKVLSVCSITGASANGKIRGEILPEGLLRYLSAWCVAPVG